jgi:hypothetical protein
MDSGKHLLPRYDGDRWDAKQCNFWCPYYYQVVHRNEAPRVGVSRVVRGAEFSHK